MERPAWAPQGIDLTVPSVSRMYDYYLGGSHNFEVDRDAARRAVAAMPSLPKLAQANRAFMRRALTHAVGEGITQFLDIGCGIPTFGSVHETAQGLTPDARVVCVDNDPVAVAHSRSVLEGNEGTGTVSADLRTPQDILHSEEVEQLLDFDEPVALLLLGVLHFVEDKDTPVKAVAELRDALAPGSLLVLTHIAPATGSQGDGTAGMQEVYRTARSPLTVRRRAEIAKFFDGFDILEPGLVPLPEWRPGSRPAVEDPGVLNSCAGVGRKVGSVG